MIDRRHARWLFAAGAALVGAACGSGNQEGPPSTQAQAETAAPENPSGAQDSMQHHHHPPPPAAFDACKDKAIGDSCTVAWKDAEIHGKCEPPPPGTPASGPACRP